MGTMWGPYLCMEYIKTFEKWGLCEEYVGTNHLYVVCKNFRKVGTTSGLSEDHSKAFLTFYTYWKSGHFDDCLSSAVPSALVFEIAKNRIW